MALYSLTKTQKDNLRDSLSLLNIITRQSYNDKIRDVALAFWKKNLQAQNPQWQYVRFKAFYIDNSHGKAHVFAMVDQRLPNKGIVGYFACTNTKVGSEVLNRACEWLKDRHKVKDVYGPINGTLPNDYRINLRDDFVFPGEPVNPSWYLEAFTVAGFSEFNRYGSGRLKHFNIIKGDDFKKYHELRNRIFPHQSVYCPSISLEERIYNSSGKFDPKYTFFLLDGQKEVGFAMAYIYERNLILKTIGILPKYRGMKLSSLLLEPIHKNAVKDGARTAIYAMVREGNEVHRRKHPLARIFRRYVTMHKSV
jgi:ribosomal protein S18 acetylase RimI-like enzyme